MKMILLIENFITNTEYYIFPKIPERENQNFILKGVE